MWKTAAYFQLEIEIALYVSYIHYNLIVDSMVPKTIYLAYTCVF